jgi:hypothetical protein
MAASLTEVRTKIDGRWTGKLFKNTNGNFVFEQVRNDIEHDSPKWDDDECVQHLGLFIKNKELVDYDAGFYLIKLALDMLKEEGIKVDASWYEDVEPCSIS